MKFYVFLTIFFDFSVLYGLVLSSEALLLCIILKVAVCQSDLFKLFNNN